jgi:hypothetical protein
MNNNIRNRISNLSEISKNMDYFRKSGGIPHGFTYPDSHKQEPINPGVSRSKELIKYSKNPKSPSMQIFIKNNTKNIRSKL